MGMLQCSALLLRFFPVSKNVAAAVPFPQTPTTHGNDWEWGLLSLNREINLHSLVYRKPPLPGTPSNCICLSAVPMGARAT